MPVILYVKIYKNRFEIENINKEQSSYTFYPEKPFTSERLLVGEFFNAEKCLKKAFAEIVPDKIFRKRIFVLMHPMEMTENGLSEVEKRVFTELGEASGGGKSFIWVGKKLSKDEVKKKF